MRVVSIGDLVTDYYYTEDKFLKNSQNWVLIIRKFVNVSQVALMIHF